MTYQLPSNANVRLLDSYYKSDSLTNGRAFKGFFKELGEQVFVLNLRIYEDIGEFPLAYEEKKAYSSISYAIHSLTPYAWSECHVDIKQPMSSEGKESKPKDKWRFVDFWCMSTNKQFEAYIESKKLWLNISENARWKFDSACCERIQKALNQLKDIKSAKVEMVSLANGASFKVALFVIPLVYAPKGKPNLKDIESAPKCLEECLSGYLDDRKKMGLLMSVLDLRPFGGESASSDGPNPFTALVAIVWE
ncbi:hypothetical protein [Helicobacter fennelliae]|uniref:Uncharacterized protein n=1 Tax=Helicobacter fennelliae MRY12-0050 TaxID=1325130 RepID=T1DVT6_9HELI|nr:hypothetical protein [Helicobacter fennelliae]GAD18827.1 hypothetical protein HFN_2239 [Helicobacter fennelliae MRY12-0050]STP07014.1 Uncharacterised protein [Helicobacter fennelliae]